MTSSKLMPRWQRLTHERVRAAAQTWQLALHLFILILGRRSRVHLQDHTLRRLDGRNGSRWWRHLRVQSLLWRAAKVVPEYRDAAIARCEDNRLQPNENLLEWLESAQVRRAERDEPVMPGAGAASRCCLHWWKPTDVRSPVSHMSRPRKAYIYIQPASETVS